MNDSVKNQALFVVVIVVTVMQALAFQQYFMLIPLCDSTGRFLSRRLPVSRWWQALGAKAAKWRLQVPDTSLRFAPDLEAPEVISSRPI